LEEAPNLSVVIPAKAGIQCSARPAAAVVPICHRGWTGTDGGLRGQRAVGPGFRRDDGRWVGSPRGLVPNKGRHVVPIGEAVLEQVILVLPDTRQQVGRDTDVDRPALAARHHVDEDFNDIR
jgi:hypothetical protein